MAKPNITTYLSHVPLSIKDGGLVAFVVLESKNAGTAQEASGKEQRETRSLYYVCGKNEQELWHSKDVLDYILQKTTEVAVVYDQVSFEKGKPVFDAIVNDFNNSGNYAQSRFNFAHRIVDYARHFNSLPKQP